MAAQIFTTIEPLLELDDLLLKTWILTLLPGDIPWLLENVPAGIPFAATFTASNWKKQYNKLLNNAEVYIDD